MVFVEFIYGLAFFSLGLVIALETFRPITPAVKPAFRSLAAFALLYALHQWIELALTVGIVRTQTYGVVVFDVSVMAIAVLFLVRFSGLLFSRRWEVTVALPVGLLLVWLAFLALRLDMVKDPVSFHEMADDTARYILILPANLLAAWGLLKGRLMGELENGNINKDKIVLGTLFAANAVFSGILVTKAAFFPARLVNTEAFAQLTGVPVALVRSALAVAITIFMVRALRVFEYTFLKERLAKEAMERDAKIAAEIQMELVPKAPLKVDGAEVYARLLPARFVGGDTFDYFASEGVLTFMIGDASGKGSPAALLCTAGLMTLETELRSNDRPRDILTQANTRLAKRFPVGSFMTAALGRYFPDKKLIEMASSGQNQPLIYRKNDRVWRSIDLPGSLPLGVEAVAGPVEARVAMCVGDRLVLYTDGLIDVRTPAGRRVGFDAILEWLNAHADSAPERLLDDLVLYLAEVSGGELYDDVTVLLVDITAENTASLKDVA